MVDLSKFKDIFLLEAEEHIQKINQNILALEKKLESGSAGADIIKILDELMRSSHTIKGSSASMGYVKLAFLTHVMEDVFDSARNQTLQLTQDLVDALYDSIDKIEQSIKTIKETGQEIDTDVFTQELKKITGVETEGVGKSALKPEKIMSQAGDSPENAVLKGSDQSDQPEYELVDEAVEIAKIDYIKVPVERLDSLMDLVEELLIDKMRLERLASQYPDIKEVSAHLSLLLSGIQFKVMQSRLVPVDQVFGRFPRMIRDLARKQEKKIDFTVMGGEIELDRTIIDKLGEPLVHLLRNAVDHGIEKQGRIILRAARESDYALFSVENDCNIIDFEEVRKAAIKRNIVTEADGKNLSLEQVEALLFHPRLSTRDVVSEISGRGVGLSVVKNFADMLNGRVVVENLDPGARFTLELPLSLAIINSLLVEADGSVFAIPFNNVSRSVKIERSGIKKMADKDVAIIDGRNIPLVRFSQVFGRRSNEKIEVKISAETESFLPDADAGLSGVTAVIVKKDDDLIGLVVDKLVNVQEIIVKPLSSILKIVKGFSGSTILGDGKVILIIDVPDLIQAARS